MPAAWSVKKLLRAQAKLLADYEGRVDRLTDVARASLVCEDVAQLRRAVDALLQRKDVVVSLKNRWAEPVDGYADVLVNVRLPPRGVVAEIQLHTKAVYSLKGDSGHSTYKWLRRLVQPDDVYEGETDAEGRPHGFGRRTFAAGDVYEGNYRRGLKHGNGRYVSSDGNEYDGDWCDDKKHGFGRIQFANGNLYEGEFRDGRIDGRGTKPLAQGGSYAGEWRQGKPEGHGVQTFREDDECARYEGAFRLGVKDGSGVLAYVNGDAYSGLFFSDKPNGEGELVQARDGTRLKGQFNAGAFVSGKVTKADGTVYEGRFRGRRDDTGEPLLIGLLGASTGSVSSSSSSSKSSLCLLSDERASRVAVVVAEESRYVVVCSTASSSSASTKSNLVASKVPKATGSEKFRDKAAASRSSQNRATCGGVESGTNELATIDCPSKTWERALPATSTTVDGSTEMRAESMSLKSRLLRLTAS